MSLTLAILGDFGGAIDFVFQERDSVSGGVQIGGLGEIGELTVEHLKVSAVAMAAACAISIPTGLYLGHRGKGEFVAVATTLTAEVRIPAKMVGSARGNLMRPTTCMSLMPTPLAASTISGLIWRTPT